MRRCLECTVDTHVHADHITGAQHLKERTDGKIAAPAMDRLPCVDEPIEGLGGDRALADFVQLMAELKLPYPKFIDYAVPGNKSCGICRDDLPEHMQSYCRKMEESPQG